MSKLLFEAAYAAVAVCACLYIIVLNIRTRRRICEALRIETRSTSLTKVDGTLVERKFRSTWTLK